jgi:sensor c-di-GMP phosphodiesterase-like protein
LRKKRLAIAVVIVVAVAAVTAPILISLYLARQQSLGEQYSRVAQLASDVLRRADESTMQMAAGIEQLRAAGAADPCSDENVALMSRVAISAEQVQGFGFVAGDRLICASFGRFPDGIPIGPPDYVSSRNVIVRSSVALPNAPDVKFLLITPQAAGGYTAVVHPKLPLDVFVDNPKITVGLVAYSQKKVIDVRGTYDPHWIVALDKGQAAQFTDDANVIGVRRSIDGDFVAVAAIPAIDVESGVRRFALVLLPFGVIAGGVLAFAVLHIARLQLALPAVIKVGLRRNEFFVEYQPVVDLKTGTWAGVEALLRWRRTGGEVVRPDIFIPVAEETGLIGRITERVVDLVADDVAGLFAEYPDFHVALNLSAIDVTAPRTPALLDRLVARTGGHARNFVVEITERGLIKGEAAKAFLHAVREKGMGIAIDDFGTGYSSLSYLQTFDVDFLKIDKTFVDTIGADAATSHVVSHIVEMAKGLDLQTIAEGVETETQANFLRDRGVRYAQGWLFAKAMPMAELKAKLKVHRGPLKAGA